MSVERGYGAWVDRFVTTAAVVVVVERDNGRRAVILEPVRSWGESFPGELVRLPVSGDETRIYRRWS